MSLFWKILIGWGILTLAIVVGPLISFVRRKDSPGGTERQRRGSGT